MRVPNFLVAVFMLVVVIGCSGGTSIQPIITNEKQPFEIERLELLRSLVTEQEVINKDILEVPSTPDPVIPIINWGVYLCGYWLANYTVEEVEVEVLFIIREDSTFSSSAALNGSRATEWDNGIWKFELYDLHLLFLFDEDAGWKTAVYYDTHFVYEEVVFFRQDELPTWAEN